MAEHTALARIPGGVIYGVNTPPERRSQIPNHEPALQ
jgi:hypothetical protein